MINKKFILTQFFVLLVGVLFAWTNFTIELINWFQKKSCTLGCSAGLVNPFLTPCFYGAIFFLIAFCLSVAILQQSNGTKK